MLKLFFKGCLPMLIVISLLLNMAFSQTLGYDKLNVQLEKQKIEFNSYDQARIPLLIGNTEMGSLADPFGRGVYETMFNDVWSNSEQRVGLPGLMLDSPQFSRQPPDLHYQSLSLQNGSLTTRIAYRQGYAYETLMTYCMEKRTGIYCM